MNTDIEAFMGRFKADRVQATAILRFIEKNSRDFVESYLATWIMQRTAYYEVGQKYVDRRQRVTRYKTSAGRNRQFQEAMCQLTSDILHHVDGGDRPLFRRSDERCVRVEMEVFRSSGEADIAVIQGAVG